MPLRKKAQARQMLPLDLPLNGCVALGQSFQGSEPGLELKEVTIDKVHKALSTALHTQLSVEQWMLNSYNRSKLRLAPKILVTGPLSKHAMLVSLGTGLTKKKVGSLPPLINARDQSQVANGS